MSISARPSAILFGDSITQFSFAPGGWGARVADHYSRKLDVFCRGFSGYTTSTAKHLLPHVFPGSAEAPLFVTVFFGANDASCPVENPAQHVPVTTYEANLAALVDHIRQASHPQHIVLISPPAIHNRKERSNELTAPYVAVGERVANAKGCLFLNLFADMLAHADYSSLLCDGLHLSPEGNTFVFERLVALLPVKADTLPVDFPLWRDMPEDGQVDGKSLDYPCWYLTSP